MKRWFFSVFSAALLCVLSNGIYAETAKTLNGTTVPAKSVDVAIVKPIELVTQNAKLQVATADKQSVQIVEDKKSVDWFTRILAIVALLVGLANFLFSIWKLYRDRKLSVKDDFWFRKIISPATIEPMLKVVTSLLDEVPTEMSNKLGDENFTAQYAQKVTLEFAKLYSAVQTLALFDEALPSKVIEKLRSCEDILSEHINTLSEPNRSKQISTIQLRQKVLAELNSALKAIMIRHTDYLFKH